MAIGNAVCIEELEIQVSGSGEMQYDLKIDRANSKPDMGSQKRIRATKAMVSSSSALHDETVELTRTEHGTRMEDLPTQIIEGFVDRMAPFTRLCFQGVSKYIRSTVQGYRTQGTSEPSILMSLISPPGLNDRAVGKSSPLCWVLEPTRMKWCPLKLPVVDIAHCRYSDWPITVHSAGTSGFLVLKHRRTTELVVGNPMTQEWQKVVNSPLRLLVNDNGFVFGGIEFAIHLAVSERAKEKPTKLVIFSKQQARTHITISALWFCFSSKEWNGAEHMAHITIASGPMSNARVHDKICACDDTDNGIVFILISKGAPATRRYLVVSYSVAQNEFAIAVPWCQATHLPCPWMDMILTFAKSTTTAAASSCNNASGKWQSHPIEYDERNHDFKHCSAIMGDNSTSTARMEGLVQQLQLLMVSVSKSARAYLDIQVLRFDGDAKAWKAMLSPVHLVAKSFVKGKRTVYQPLCSWIKGNPSFETARSGQHWAFLAGTIICNTYCTRIGGYNMDTGEVQIVATLELPMDLYSCESKFSIQYFHPNFNQGLCKV